MPRGSLWDVSRRWWLACCIGKHKPTYATHIDTGDFVVVINAEQAVLTGGKEEKKVYHCHTGYPGGIKSETAGKLLPAPARRAGRGGGLGHAPQGPARPRRSSASSRSTRAPSTRTRRSSPRASTSPRPCNPKENSNVSQVQYYGTGRRKTAAARVFLRPGSGGFQINGRTLDSYFPNEVLKMVIKQPLQLTESVEQFDIRSRWRVAAARARPGDPARHLARPARVQRRAARPPEVGRVPDARPAQEGTQEVRPEGCPGSFPVQQALEGQKERISW